MKFITLIFTFLLLITFNNPNAYSFENKNNIKIRPLKTTPFGKYDFNKLEKIMIPFNFPTHRAMGWEHCKNSKGQKWSTQLTFYLSKDLAWGIRSSTKYIRVYMTKKINNNLNFQVYEASKEWKTKKDWISGYKINLSNDLSSSLKKEIKGKYVSGGGYWRSCTIKFDTINEARDTLTKSDWLTILKREQSLALHRLNFFGLKVTQKYDFESISKKFDKILTAEVRAAKLADEKTKKKLEEKEQKRIKANAKRLEEESKSKLTKEKAKRETEEKAKKLAKQKAKREAKEKAKKLAEEKAKRKAEEKAKKLAEEKTKREAEEKAKREAEEKAKKLAEEKAKREAEEKAKKLAEDKAKREAEEKAKLIAKKKEEEIIKNLNWYRMSSEGFKRLLISDNYIFNFKNSQNNELNGLHSKINKYLKMSNIEISNDEILELKSTIEAYNKLFKKVHTENKKSGVYGKFNYQDVPVKLQNDLENDFRETNDNLTQFIKILNSYFDDHVDLKNETNVDFKNFMKTKLDENEFIYFTKIMSKEKISELEKIDRESFKLFFQKFLMKASYHISLGNKVDLAIREWLENYQGKFISYYNKKIYNLSIKKNLKEIEKKQKNEEDFFNKIGN